MSDAFDTDTERDAIRALVATLYRAISGPAGAPRDWDSFLTCYAAEGRITPFEIAGDGALHFDVMTPAQYVESRTRLLSGNAFYEREVRHECAIEGRIANVFSHYEARRTPDGPAFTSGVNSLQLVRFDEGWRVLSITWRFTGG